MERRRGGRSSGTGVTVDLTDDERTALVNLLTVEIEASKFPLSPRIEQLKRIRAISSCSGGRLSLMRGFP